MGKDSTPQRTVFTYGSLTRAGVILAAAVFTACLVAQWGDRDTTLRGALGMATLVAMAGLGEVFLGRVVLGAKALELHFPLRQAHYPREAIAEVVATRGGYLSIRLQDGQWRSIPTMGLDNTRMAVAIRAWMEGR
jgi:hypothetical protein